MVVATRLMKLILNPYDVTFSAGGLKMRKQPQSRRCRDVTDKTRQDLQWRGRSSYLFIKLDIPCSKLGASHLGLIRNWRHLPRISVWGWSIRRGMLS